MSALSRLLKRLKRPDPTPDPMPEAIDRASRKSHAAALKREELKRDEHIKKHYREHGERIRENIKRRLEEADEVPLSQAQADIMKSTQVDPTKFKQAMAGGKYPAKIYSKPISKEDLKKHTNIEDPDVFPAPPPAPVRLDKQLGGEYVPALGHPHYTPRVRKGPDVFPAPPPARMGDEVPLSPAPPDLDAFAKSMQVDPAKFNEALKTMGPSERKVLLEAMRKVRPF